MRTWVEKGNQFYFISSIVVLGLFGGASPVNAATVAQTDLYLKLAGSAAKKLAPQLTSKGNAQLKEVDLHLFIQTRDNLNKTKTALKLVQSYKLFRLLEERIQGACNHESLHNIVYYHYRD
jgi:hypothetical protein